MTGTPLKSGCRRSRTAHAVETHRVGLDIADFTPRTKQRMHTLLDIGTAARRGYAPEWGVPGFTLFSVAAGVVPFAQRVLR